MIDRSLAPTTPLISQCTISGFDRQPFVINALDQDLEIIAKPSSGENYRLKVAMAP
jgi:hypothetical protein